MVVQTRSQRLTASDAGDSGCSSISSRVIPFPAPTSRTSPIRKKVKSEIKVVQETRQTAKINRCDDQNTFSRNDSSSSCNGPVYTYSAEVPITTTGRNRRVAVVKTEDSMIVYANECYTTAVEVDATATPTNHRDACGVKRGLPRTRSAVREKRLTIDRLTNGNSDRRGGVCASTSGRHRDDDDDEVSWSLSVPQQEDESAALLLQRSGGGRRSDGDESYERCSGDDDPSDDEYLCGDGRRRLTSSKRRPSSQRSTQRSGSKRKTKPTAKSRQSGNPSASRKMTRNATASPRTPMRSARRRAAAIANAEDVGVASADGDDTSPPSNRFVGIIQSAAKRTPITDACLKMTLNVVPDDLPCREVETRKIMEHLTAVISTGGGGGCLYISGMPGTGKTATVMSAIRKLRTARLPAFQVVEVNAMRVNHPNSVFQVIYRQMFNKRAPQAEKSYRQLDRMFNTQSEARPVCVLVVDEIDGLVTKRQNVLYTLFDWPTLRHSRLAVIAIANTMDLPERMMPRCVSRLGFGRLDFYPYTKDQIIHIITQRLLQPAIQYDDKENVRNSKRNLNEEASIDEVQNIKFEGPAIEMCARKVASLSGDLRRALQICKRSLEIAYMNGNLKVQLQDVTAAAKEMYSSPFIAVIQLLPFFHKLLLLAIVLEIRFSRGTSTTTTSWDRIGASSVPVRKILDRIRNFLNITGVFGVAAYMSMSQVKQIIVKLAESNIISLMLDVPTENYVEDKAGRSTAGREGQKMSSGPKLQKVSPMVDEDGYDLAVALIPPEEEVEVALSEEPFCQKQLKL